VKLDAARTHFVGRLPHAQYVRVLQVSAAHVYLTYPFVLSWSLLEAMACGVPIVASDTAPVREVICDAENGRLVEFFNVEALARTTLELLDNKQVTMRQQAQADARRYSLSEGVTGYDHLIAHAPPDSEPTREPGPISMLSNEARQDSILQTADRLDVSDREWELLRLLSAGHTTERIAELRKRSPATVRNQLSALYQKLGVTRRTEAIAKATTLSLQESKS
jgi:DNA-binding CsgD family transcriptional regulator